MGVAACAHARNPRFSPIVYILVRELETREREMGCVQRPNCSLSDMQVTHANSVVFIISASSQ